MDDDKSDQSLNWFKLSKEGRVREIVLRRKNNESFADIAEALLGDRNKKTTIWHWYKRNIKDIQESMSRFEFTDADQWVMFDIMQSLFPRLDATMVHLLEEIKALQTRQNESMQQQKDKFNLTASFLDSIEERMSKGLNQMASQLRASGVSRGYPVSSSNVGTGPPPPPSSGGIPPPPPGSGLPSPTAPPTGDGNIPGPFASLGGDNFRTDFEEMDLEDIKVLPREFLENLSTTDRTRIQNRVKEIKMLSKMSSEDREAYLTKKREEKERASASEDLGSSLKTMLDDQDSLFSRMKRAAEVSAIEGSGTFGSFTTDFIYSYCIACSKSTRNEDEAANQCSYCGSDLDHLVEEEEKLNYKYYECLDCKMKELVDENFSRGSTIIIKSRWKIADGDSEPKNHSLCKSKNIREISSAILTKEDPDKQFSYPLMALKKILQKELTIKNKEPLKNTLSQIYNALQSVPDIVKQSEARKITKKFLDLMKPLLDELRSIANSNVPDSEIIDNIDNLFLDLKELQTEESPQHYLKMNETNQFISKIDQLITRILPILEKTLSNE